MYCLDVFADGTVVSGDRCGCHVVWDMTSGKPLAQEQNHTSPMYDLKVESERDLIFTASLDETIGVSDRSGELREKISGHDDSVCALAVCDGGFHFASGSDDKSVRVWELGDGGGSSQIAKLDGNDRDIWSLALAPGPQLLSGGGDGTVRRWDLPMLPPVTAYDCRYGEANVKGLMN